MEFVETSLPGVILVRPKVFGDTRGFFTEVYHSQKFALNGIDASFVQDNLSRSARGVLRGLHYQLENPQGKLVTCLAGEIFDVAVDLRRHSPNFGKWFGVLLNETNRESLFIPAGFAHGFCVLSESADVFYKCTNLYHPASERTLIWNDRQVGIEWPVEELVKEIGSVKLSEKDQAGQSLDVVETFE